MSRRSSITNRNDSGISRELNTDIAYVKIVAQHIDTIIKAVELAEITDFTNITVVAGSEASWDHENKILTVPTLKGDTGDTLFIAAIDAAPDGSFVWHFSDGSQYTTPSLKGDKGDRGDTLAFTSIVAHPDGSFTWTFSDSTTFTTPVLRGPKGDKGDQGDRGPVGATGVFSSVTATTLAPGTPASITLGGSPELRTMVIGVPKGDKGNKGDKGDPGSRGASFAVDKVGLLSELHDYDAEEEGFVFFAKDVTSIENASPISQTFPYSASNQYTLTEPVGGEQVLLVFVNNVFQTDNAYTVAIDESGIATVNIAASPGDFIHVREIGSATVFGAVFFKLSNTFGDWSDPVPFGRGPQGETGSKGDTGTTAYEIWLAAGNTGSETDFLLSLVGAPGVPGTHGASAYDIWLLQGNTGTEADFIATLKGTDGTDGISAYEQWLAAGNVGTELEFLESLKGRDGLDSIQEGPTDGNIYGRKDGDWHPLSDTFVQKTRSITTSSLLTGGGDLTQNRQLGIAAGVTNQNAIVLSDGSLDAITIAGNYLQAMQSNATAANSYPEQVVGLLEVVVIGASVQQKYSTSTSRVYLRHSSGGSWANWKELVDPAVIRSMINDSTIGEIRSGPYAVIPTGYLPLEGGTIFSYDYPKLRDYIHDHYKVVTVSSFSSSIANDNKGAFLQHSQNPFMLKLPDMRGLFVRGSGGNAEALGVYQEDAIRNITGWFADVAYQTAALLGTGGGAFRAKQGVGNAAVYPTQIGVGGDKDRIDFDASRVVRTANENRPVNVAWRYIIKAE